MNNYFETSLSKEQQNKIKATVSAQVGKELFKYHQSPCFVVDALKNLHNVKGRLIALKIVLDHAKKCAQAESPDPDTQKMLVRDFKKFIKKNTGCVSSRYDWKTLYNCNKKSKA